MQSVKFVGLALLLCASGFAAGSACPTPDLGNGFTCNQYVTFRGTGTAVSNSTALTGTTAGRLLIIAIESDGDVAPTGVACGGTTANQDIVNSSGGSRIYSIPNVAAGVTSCTVSYASSNMVQGVIFEVSGAATITPFDKGNGSFTIGTTWTTGSTGTLTSGPGAWLTVGHAYCGSASGAGYTVNVPFNVITPIVYDNVVEGNTTVLGLGSVTATTAISYGGTSSANMPTAGRVACAFLRGTVATYKLGSGSPPASAVVHRGQIF